MDPSIDHINFQLAIEAGRIGTWKRDLATNLITQSPITSQILGHGEGETVIPFSLLDSYTDPEDMKKFREPLEVALQSGEPFDLEFKIRHPSGKLRWIAIRGKSVKDDTGEPIQVIGVMFDVTEKKQAAERFRLLTEFSPDAILVELNWQLIYANPAAVQLLGLTGEADLRDHSMFDFAAPECRRVLLAMHRAIDEKKPASPLFEMELRRSDGSTVEVQAVCGFIYWDGQPATQIMLRDVTELKRTQSQVKHLRERLELIIEGTGGGIWEWKIPENKFTFSGGFNKIVGNGDQSSEAVTLDWYAIIHPEDASRVELTFQESLKQNTPVYGCEFRIKTADGGWKWVRTRGIIVEQDRNGQPLVMAGTLTDITVRKESDEIAWKHANLDVLTSLPNRRLFRQCLDFEIHKSRHANRQFALLLVDLDGFKRVNDLYGNDSGDLLLIEAARRIKAWVNDSITVARIGGDEFTVILSDLQRVEEVDGICPKILSSLSAPFQLGSNMSYVSASIGVSLYPLDAVEAEELVRKADQAMHVAKNTGKNRFAYFTKDLDDKAHERLRVMNDLHTALSLGQLEVHYQPIVDLKTSKVVKAEALLRWFHPQLGQVPPSLFIPLAEESGVITLIGRWMFSQAVEFCKKCGTLLDDQFQVGINMSPLQFVSDGHELDWAEYLAQQGLPGGRIVIEITEGILLNASEKVFDRFREIRKAGMQIALDDFGTGYSSMSYLQKFDIDYIKIDQSFIRNVTSRIDSRTIAETIVVMAHKLGKKVIAEGIETQQQLDFLIEVGCDYGQGYLFFKAVPSQSCIEFASNGGRGAGWSRR